MSKPILGYWDVRGLGEACRLMLEYCGVDYQDKRYTAGDAPDFDRSDWLNEKLTLDFEFPNLPYYIDSDVKLTENLAILKYIARRNSLMPVSDADVTKCDVLEGVIIELRLLFGMMCYMPNFETNKANFFKQTLPVKMELLDKHLAKNKWLCGDQLTYIDFIFNETLSQIQVMEPTSTDQYKNVVKHHKNFFELDKIAAYRQSNRFKKVPVMAKWAQWHGE